MKSVVYLSVFLIFYDVIPVFSQSEFSLDAKVREVNYDGFKTGIQTIEEIGAEYAGVSFTSTEIVLSFISSSVYIQSQKKIKVFELGEYSLKNFKFYVNWEDAYVLTKSFLATNKKINILFEN